MTKRYAEVALDLPVDNTFSYSVPAELAPVVAPGMRVLVPLGSRTLTGFVTELTDAPAPGVGKVRDIKDVLDPAPLIDARRLEFYRWLAAYHLAPLGGVLAMAVPAGMDIKSRKLVTITEAGLGAASSLKGTDARVLAEVESAGKRGVRADTLARRMRGVPVYASIERLRRKGLATVEVVMTGGAGELTRLTARATNANADAEATLGRAPLQRRVLEHLRANGEAAVAELEKEIKGAGAAVRALADKGLAEITSVAVRRDPFSGVRPRPLPHTPNAEQQSAIDAICGSIKSGKYSPYLLYGVTGSGKTLVYIKAIEEAVSSGKRALVLTPEIALTPWPAAYLAERFPGRVALAHSGLSGGERFDEWQRIASKDIDVVVGARSALFAPISNLGLIIVDEEHETSYKQEEGIRYNARNAALVLGRILGATVVLGSATPSVETFHNARTGKISRLTLTSRVEERPMPTVELVDMRAARRTEVLSKALTERLAESLDAGHQGLLFINRRGFSSFLICTDCGSSFNCDNCSVTLTMHKGAGLMRCHYCDHSTPIPSTCPVCMGVNLTTPGMGTEKVEEEIVNAFPGIKTARMDRDTTRARGSAQRIVDMVEGREVDVLIGTQMVSKGHDFPGVTLVGVISSDTGLNIPDFRSAERTFQLLTQAAGRAGRAEAPGRVVIQTLNPGHYCLTSAAGHDYEGFFETELAFRAEACYPPFTRLCCVRIDGAGERTVERAADRLGEIAHATTARLGEKGRSITVLGPVPAMVARLKGRYRWNLLVKCPEVGTLLAYVRAVRDAFEADGTSGGNKGKAPFRRGSSRGVNLTIDIDPVTIA